ncbi:MAG: hypothetical protein MGF17_09535 [Trichodesmium sp. MAG_R04]|nr:hypothetical protein [Trichodesmium sp. MAG_R04]
MHICKITFFIIASSQNKDISGIDREIYLENKTSLIDKHLPSTEKSQTELERKRIVYLFSDRDRHGKSRI